MFSLIKLAPRIYHLRVTSQYDLCSIFMRYQEFYESSNERFVNQKFTLAEFSSWYTRNVGNGEFSYCTDWCGFNMPLKIIKNCRDLGISDPNMYDSIMSGIHDMIECIDPDSYIIGSTPELDALDHEITHAMFYVNETYKEQVIKTIANISKTLWLKLITILENEAYAPHVYIDEINAYLTESSVHEFFEEFKINQEFKKLRNNLLVLRKKFIPNDQTPRNGSKTSAGRKSKT